MSDTQVIIEWLRNWHDLDPIDPLLDDAAALIERLSKGNDEKMGEINFLVLKTEVQSKRIAELEAATIEKCARLAESHVGEHGDDRTTTAEEIAESIRALLAKE